MFRYIELHSTGRPEFQICFTHINSLLFTLLKKLIVTVYNFDYFQRNYFQQFFNHFTPHKFYAPVLTGYFH